MLIRHLVARLAVLVSALTTTACLPSPPAQRNASAATTTSSVVVPAARNSNGTLQKFPPAPADIPGKMLVFAYADFGPPAAAHALLGLDCYGDCCCSRLTDTFDVRVVVFAGVERAQVSARYVSTAELGEYRLVALADALHYLETTLADRQHGAVEDRIPALDQVLQATMHKLRRDFAVGDTSSAR